MTGATVQNAAAQSEPSVSVHIPFDSLALEPGDLLPSPVNFSAIPPSEPLYRPEFSAGGNFLPEIAPASRLTSTPSVFAMPDRDLFIAYDRFLRQEGITISAASVNSARMILSGSGYMPLLRRGDHSLGIAGSQQRYPSMAFFNSALVTYSWAPTDGITLYGNLHASDNMYHLNRFKDIGVSGRVRVRVTDGIWINGYGNYTLYNNAGLQQIPMGMYPTNSFGGTIEVKITDKFGVEGGAMREYDPFRRRWVTNPYFKPVSY